MNSDTKPNSVFIGEGVSFKGSISAPEQAIIEGQFEGDLSVSNLLIGQTGRVTGTIKADRVDVKGELNKDISSRQLLIVRSTGKVNGTLEYGEIEIERGGQVRGNMTQV
jgi:cytoskeletal protein CcmA (bactofilin family)